MVVLISVLNIRFMGFLIVVVLLVWWCCVLCLDCFVFFYNE